MALMDELYTKYRKGVEELKALDEAATTEKRDLDAEERKQFEKISDDLSAMQERMEEIKKSAELRSKLEADFRELGLDTAQRSDVKIDISTQFRDLYRGAQRELEYRMTPSEMTGVEQRDLVKGTPASGGHTVPVTLYGQIRNHLVDVSGLLKAGPEIWTTTSGENIDVPVIDSWGSDGAIVAEAAAIGESDPNFAKRTLGAYKFARTFDLSRELLEDSAVPIDGIIAKAAGIALGRGLGNKLINGTGTAEPTGILASTTAGVTGGTGVAGAPTADNITDLCYSVAEPYTQGNSVGWLMRRATMGAIRKFKDGQQQYLWQPSIAAGQPETLLGFPVYNDPFVPAVALSAKSVIFGDISTYLVRQVNSLRFERSDHDKFTNDLVTFKAVIRADGILVDQTGSVKHFVGGAT